MSDIHQILGAIGREHPPAGLRDRIMTACSQAEPVEDISHDDCLELASAYLDGELQGDRCDAFEAHVFACEPCYLAFKQMERTTSLLRETPPAPAPAGLHERITAAVAREAAPKPAFTWQRAAKVLGGLAAAAALLAAVLVPRGGDGTDSSTPVIAEAPPEVAAVPADDAQAVDEPVEPASVTDAAPEPATPTGETAIAAAPSTVREAPTARSTRPRADLSREETPEPTSVRETTTAPSAQPEPAREERVSTPASGPAGSAGPSRTVERPRAPERATPEPQPVTDTERPAPSPVRERTPEATPEPPARTPAPRETVIAATPRDPAPEPVTTREPAPEPATPTTASTRERPRDRQPTRIASVVPTQAPVRARYQPEPTSVSERSEKLARMNAGINGSQTPALDNPTMGMELN